MFGKYRSPRYVEHSCAFRKPTLKAEASWPRKLAARVESVTLDQNFGYVAQHADCNGLAIENLIRILTLAWPGICELQVIEDIQTRRTGALKARTSLSANLDAEFRVLAPAALLPGSCFLVLSRIPKH